MSIKKLSIFLLVWRVFTILIVVSISPIFPLQTNFLGGGYETYLLNPTLWSLANFDGEHYLAISREGYRPLTHFFFPVYPLLINFIASHFGDSMYTYLYSGIFISHLSLLIGLVGFIKLIEIEHSKRISVVAILLLLIFPTSYFFGNVYTESIFFAFSVWSMYLFRNKKYVLAGLLGGLSSATRIFGLALISYFLVEILLKNKKTFETKSLITPILTFGGIASYMYYLYASVGDPLVFYNNISIFGEQRSNSLILFPQVFYRYIFKIIPSLSFDYFPVVFTTLLEFVTASLFLILITLLFVKKMWGYAIFSFAIFSIEAFSGSFSSFPRYSLSIFPAFIIAALYFVKLSKLYQFLIITLMVLSFIVSISLYSRGYWVS